MDYLALGIIGFVVGLSGAMLPGPMLVYTISKVLEGKKTSVLFIVLGHIFIEAVMIVLLLLGLRQMISSKVIYNAVAILGAGVFILMGLHIIFKSKEMKLLIAKKVNFSAWPILGGVFFTAFNPTFPTWWVSVGASLLSRALLFGIVGVVTLVLGHWLADFSWFSLVGFTVRRGKSWLNEERYQLTLKILALILVGLGFWSIRQTLNQ